MVSKKASTQQKCIYYSRIVCPVTADILFLGDVNSSILGERKKDAVQKHVLT
jgi:hypothetical protein